MVQTRPNLQKLRYNWRTNPNSNQSFFQALSPCSGSIKIVKYKIYKKAVLSQRWPRDARYISSRCGDMAIRNIQDGGGPHLEFVRIENSAIRSAVPENPKNQTWSGSDHPLQRYGHSRMLGAYGTPILGEGEVMGVSDGTIRKIDGSFL